MNYLQLKDDSTFAQEEAVLAEYFGEGNYVPFHAKEILQRRIKLRPGDFCCRWPAGHSPCTETARGGYLQQ